MKLEEYVDTPVVLDARGQDRKTFNALIKEKARESGTIIIENPSGMHMLAVGLTDIDTRLIVKGNAGNYSAGLMGQEGAGATGPKVVIEGKSGWFTGDCCSSGEIIVRGSVGSNCGSSMRQGSVLVVHGNAGVRTGLQLKGATVIVGGNCGMYTALMMQKGIMVVLGDVGNKTGEWLYGGEIFVFGKVKEPLGNGATFGEVTLEDSQRLSELLSRYGFAVDVDEAFLDRSIKKIVSTQSMFYYADAYRKTHLDKLLGAPAGGDSSNAQAKGLPSAVVESSRTFPSAPSEPAESSQAVEKAGSPYLEEYHELPQDRPLRGNWTVNILNEIRMLSERGRYVMRAGGWRRRTPGLDELVILPAQVTRLNIDTYREECSTKTVLGRRIALQHGGRPLELNYPVYISGMSYGAMNKKAKMALARASAELGISDNTGEGGMIPESRQLASKLIVQMMAGRFGFKLDSIRQADAIEIMYACGAKPGLGGHLMAEKLTPEIAAIRDLPGPIDLRSPARHPDIYGADDLALKIEQLKQATDYQIPVFVKLGAGRVYDDVRLAVKVGADVIVIDGAEGSATCSPSGAIRHLGIPLLAAITQAVRALEDMQIKDEVQLVVSGGLWSGADVVKALALGADAVALATSIEIAMGCTLCNRCNLGKCKSGICTQDHELMERLDVDLAVQGIVNYVRGMMAEATMLAKAAGRTDIHNMEREDLRALTVEASAYTGIPIVGTEKVFGNEYYYPTYNVPAGPDRDGMLAEIHTTVKKLALAANIDV